MEYHTGYRAFSAEVLRSIDYNACNDDFILDNEMAAQIFYKGYEIGEVTCPTKYFDDADNGSFVSVMYTRELLLLIGLLIDSDILHRVANNVGHCSVGVADERLSVDKD